jgi:hypothetical protein
MTFSVLSPSPAPHLVTDYDDTIRSRFGVVCRRPIAYDASKARNTADVRMGAGIEEIDRPVGAIRQDIKIGL